MNDSSSPPPPLPPTVLIAAIFTIGFCAGASIGLAVATLLAAPR